MMNYENFKKRVMNEFLDYLPERYADCELEIRKVPKMNECLTGIVIRPKKIKRSYCSPTFYMERMYAQYRECGSFEKVMANQAIYLEESLRYVPDDIAKVGLSSMKDRIVFQVVNTEKNQEMIKLCPHRDFMDLSVVYRVIINIDSEGVSGYLVTYDLAAVEDLDENLLFNLAMKNTKELFPLRCERIENTMFRIMKRCGSEDKDISEAFPDLDDVPDTQKVYVVSNEYEYFGSSALMYMDFIGSIAEKIGTDCYILPSSVHDLIVMSVESFGESAKLAQLVKSTNDEHVRPSDRLSDSVYVYSRSDGTINRLEISMEEVS